MPRNESGTDLVLTHLTSLQPVAHPSSSQKQHNQSAVESSQANYNVGM
ncbi:TPA: hypothetical protein ACRR3W_001269 [Providencia stuartii]